MTVIAATLRREGRENQERFKVQDAPQRVGGCDAARSPDWEVEGWGRPSRKEHIEEQQSFFFVHAIFA